MANNINNDLLNGEISLGSSLKDLLAVCQGQWIDTIKNGWNLIKLGSKFGMALQTVYKDKSYMLPMEFENPITAIIYLGDGEITSGIIKGKQQAITAPITGVALIIIK